MANSAHYKGVTGEAYNALRSKLAGMGISIDDNAGRISQKGVSADYNYDPNEQTLDLTNIKVGFPASMIINSEKIIQQVSETIQGNGGELA
jgi:hypothetical protein